MKTKRLLAFILFNLGNLYSSPSVAASKRCFASKDELKAAIDEYNDDGCADETTSCDVSEMYGWPMNSWCVGNVTDMTDLFFEMDDFNEDISDWDSSSVTNMTSIFEGATSFNSDLSRWNTPSVERMESIFSYATSFNGNLSSWDTSSVLFCNVLQW